MDLDAWPHRSRVALPVEGALGRALCRRCVLLDLHHAPAGGDGAPGLGICTPPPRGRQMGRGHGRRFPYPHCQLSPARPPQLPGTLAERAQISVAEARRGDGGATRMTDPTTSARDDLAFVRALVSEG